MKTWQLVRNTHQLYTGVEGRGKMGSVQPCCHQCRPREPLWKHWMRGMSHKAPVVPLKSRDSQMQEDTPSSVPLGHYFHERASAQGKVSDSDKWVEETVM